MGLRVRPQGGKGRSLSSWPPAEVPVESWPRKCSEHTLNARNILVDFHCISSCPVAVKFFTVPGERILVQTLRFKRDKSAQPGNS